MNVDWLKWSQKWESDLRERLKDLHQIPSEYWRTVNDGFEKMSQRFYEAGFNDALNSIPVINQSWFDKIQLNMREAGPGRVGVHVWKSGQSCRYLVFSLTELTESGFFAKLHERAKIAWQTPDPHAQPCPHCGQDQRQHRRRYEGRAFCAFCGVGLDAIDYDAPGAKA